jgi:hypothetical protein
MGECIFCGKSGVAAFASEKEKGICGSCNRTLFKLLVTKNKSALEIIIEDTAHDAIKRAI